MSKIDIVVDRDAFLAWMEGILFERVGNKMVVGDTRENRSAERILRRGGLVLLTRRGCPFSMMALDKKKNSFVEKRIR